MDNQNTQNFKRYSYPTFLQEMYETHTNTWPLRVRFLDGLARIADFKDNAEQNTMEHVAADVTQAMVGSGFNLGNLGRSGRSVGARRGGVIAAFADSVSQAQHLLASKIRDLIDKHLVVASEVEAIPPALTPKLHTGTKLVKSYGKLANLHTMKKFAGRVALVEGH